MGRDDREEERAVPYLVANLLVPDIAAPKFALIEPDFDAGGSQCVGDTSRRLGILRGIAQEYGSSRLGHRGVAPRAGGRGPSWGCRRSRPRMSAYPNSTVRCSRAGERLLGGHEAPFAEWCAATAR